MKHQPSPTKLEGLALVWLAEKHGSAECPACHALGRAIGTCADGAAVVLDARFTRGLIRFFPCFALTPAGVAYAAQVMLTGKKPGGAA